MHGAGRCPHFAQFRARRAARCRSPAIRCCCSGGSVRVRRSRLSRRMRWRGGKDKGRSHAACGRHGPEIDQHQIAASPADLEPREAHLRDVLRGDGRLAHPAPLGSRRRSSPSCSSRPTMPGAVWTDSPVSRAISTLKTAVPADRVDQALVVEADAVRLLPGMAEGVAPGRHPRPSGCRTVGPCPFQGVPLSSAFRFRIRPAAVPSPARMAAAPKLCQ